MVRPRPIATGWLRAAAYMAVKLVLVPALMVGCCFAVGLEGANARAAVLVATLPVSAGEAPHACVAQGCVCGWGGVEWATALHAASGPSMPAAPSQSQESLASDLCLRLLPAAAFALSKTYSVGEDVAGGAAAAWSRQGPLHLHASCR